MTFTATVVQVMIASPSDLSAERAVLRSVMADWNDHHTTRTGIVALPLAWESHAVPQMGGRPQAILNEQITDSADVLVALFWTRLGSPTGDAPSGTVEEIRRHSGAGKPTLVYFSEVPVRPDSVDDEQYKALKAFRLECQAKGLIDTFESVTDLSDKFFRHLTRLLPEKFASRAAPSQPTVAGDVSGVQTPTLSREAQLLLKAASQDAHGQILFLRVLGGPRIQVSGRNFNEPGNPRSQALWEGAVEELESLGLVKTLSYKREMFALTKEGYGVADRLPESGPVGAA